MRNLITLWGLIVCASIAQAQSNDFTSVTAEVDFSFPLQEWDGFGVNYVECAQTFDYLNYPQDYGGFNVLKPGDRDSVLNMVFGPNGLQPALVKMFLDPLHQKQPGGVYDHETTTRWMRYFTKKGHEMTCLRGDSLSVITTLYAPPAYITRQKILRGRDLDPTHELDLCKYMVDWVDFLVNREKLPVKYLSLHNEGESWLRWPEDGTLGSTSEEGHDYNFFWDPLQVVRMVDKCDSLLNVRYLDGVQMTNGEPTNWYRFSYWGFAKALYDHPQALEALGLVTSHGFYVGQQEAGRWFGPHSSGGIDLLREKRPDLKAWCTSTSWDSKNMEMVEEGQIKRRYIMDAGFIKECHGNIYEAKVNAIIPWALIQRASHWNKPDPNPGSAFRVYDDGTWEVKKGYYYFKQLTTIGKPGMRVVYTSAMDSEIALIGFGSNGTKNPNAFALTNFGKTDRWVTIRLKGLNASKLMATRTCGSEIYEAYETARISYLSGDNHQNLGVFNLEQNQFTYLAPANSVTSFVCH